MDPKWLVLNYFVTFSFFALNMVFNLTERVMRGRGRFTYVLGSIALATMASTSFFIFTSNVESAYTGGILYPNAIVVLLSAYLLIYSGVHLLASFLDRAIKVYYAFSYSRVPSETNKLTATEEFLPFWPITGIPDMVMILCFIFMLVIYWV